MRERPDATRRRRPSRRSPRAVDTSIVSGDNWRVARGWRRPSAFAAWSPALPAEVERFGSTAAPSSSSSATGSTTRRRWRNRTSASPSARARTSPWKRRGWFWCVRTSWTSSPRWTSRSHVPTHQAQPLLLARVQRRRDSNRRRCALPARTRAVTAGGGGVGHALSSVSVVLSSLALRSACRPRGRGPGRASRGRRTTRRNRNRDGRRASERARLTIDDERRRAETTNRLVRRWLVRLVAGVERDFYR